MLPALLLPGAVLPAEPAYAALLAALAPDVEAAAKDLELYAGPEPPADYGLDVEVAGLLRDADASGWERFHLVGYSGGGAVALTCAAAAPERVASLALLEPAWAGAEEMSAAELMRAFMRLAIRPGVALPEPAAGEAPPWMATRPAGIRALLRAFRREKLDLASLRRFDRPVYFALGGLSNPDQYGEIAERLGRVLPDFTLEVFELRHHFDPPHRVEPERLAASLAALWARAPA